MKFETDDQHSYEVESLSPAQNRSLPKIIGFAPGPKQNEPYVCSIESPAQELVYRGAISNRIRINQLLTTSISHLQYEIVAVYGDYVQTNLLSVDAQGGFKFELPNQNSIVYYYLQVRDQEMKVLCTTGPAVVRKRQATCRLHLSHSTILPNQLAQFSLRSNIGHLGSTLSASWITFHNGQLIESGNQYSSFNNINRDSSGFSTN